MSASEAHDRHYLQARVAEESARADRHGTPFALVTLEAVPSADGQPVRRRLDAAIARLEPRLRPSDVIGKAFDDTVAILLVQTDRRGAHDALVRLRSALQGSGTWEIATYVYPEDAATIAATPLITAA